MDSQKKSYHVTTSITPARVRQLALLNRIDLRRMLVQYAAADEALTLEIARQSACSPPALGRSPTPIQSSERPSYFTRTPDICSVYVVAFNLLAEDWHHGPFLAQPALCKVSFAIHQGWPRISLCSVSTLLAFTQIQNAYPCLPWLLSVRSFGPSHNGDSTFREAVAIKVVSESNSEARGRSGSRP